MTKHTGSSIPDPYCKCNACIGTVANSLAFFRDLFTGVNDMLATDSANTPQPSDAPSINKPKKD